MNTIPEVSLPTSRCPHPEIWSCVDAMGTEIEVLDMLTALVWMLKPEVVVETGCYKGYGTERLVQGVRKNGFGHVYTCDLQSEMIELTRRDFGCSLLTIEQCTGESLIRNTSSIDFAFLDSSGSAEGRAEEVRLTVPKLSPWGVIAVHDTGETHPDIRDAIQNVVNELGLESINFCTPRGILLCKKP